MNIFVSDPDPTISAQNLDDKRVVKMVLESTQILCTAVNVNAGSQITKYKSTHINHPCNVWARDNFKNWMWLFDHATALCLEYTHRYGKTHKCEDVLMSLCWPLSYFKPAENITPFANCAARQDMNICYKHIDDVHEAYKLYLIDRWANDKITPKWTNRTRPF